MANPKKSGEEDQLARSISASAVGGHPVIITLLPFPRTLTEDGGTVRLTVTVQGEFPLGTSLKGDWSPETGTVDPITSPITADATGKFTGTADWNIDAVPPGGRYNVRVTVWQVTNELKTTIGGDHISITIVPRRIQASVTLQRSAAGATDDQALWVAIRNRTDAISFDRYDKFIKRLLCPTAPCFTDPGAFTDQGLATCDPCSSNEPAEQYGGTSIGAIRDNLTIRPNIYGPDAYYLLKLAAQAFLIFESGIVIAPPRKFDTGKPDFAQPVPGLEDPESRLGRAVTLVEIGHVLERYLGTVLGVNGKLPYLKRIVEALIPVTDSRDETLPYCGEILQHRFSCPSLLELIWSYWEEEGMLVQTLNAISRRFQNRGSGPRDPLANLEIDPLRPLNNLLWSFVQDEYNRLTVPRRAYEYDHHYGLTLLGKAVPKLIPADSRSKFIEAFHNLLNRAAIFFRADSDTR